MSVEHANPAFWAALAGFQGAVRGVGKDRTNPHLGNKYATLESVFDTIRDPLAAHGLCVTQMSVIDGNRAGCRTVVAHADGGYIECTLMLPIGEPRGITLAQAIGVSLSYARRYALMGVLGLATADEDADGGPPGAKDARQAPPQRRKPEPPPRATPPAAAPAPVAEPDLTPSGDGPGVTRGRWSQPEQRAFFAELARMGLDYERVCAVCAARGRPRPSNMAPDQRAALLAHLATPTGRASYDATTTPSPEVSGE